MLAVGAGLAPDDWASIVVRKATCQCCLLAVTFHIELLEEIGEECESFTVGNHSQGFCI